MGAIGLSSLAGMDEDEEEEEEETVGTAELTTEVVEEVVDGVVKVEDAVVAVVVVAVVDVTAAVETDEEVAEADEEEEVRFKDGLLSVKPVPEEEYFSDLLDPLVLLFPEGRLLLMLLLELLTEVVTVEEVVDVELVGTVVAGTDEGRLEVL